MKKYIFSFLLLVNISANVIAATIDKMYTSPIGHYIQTYYSGNQFLIFSGADYYKLNDGTTWTSGAGWRPDTYSSVSSISIVGNKIRYTFNNPTGDVLFQNTDYSFGDHSAQGVLGVTGPLVIEATIGSSTAKMSGYAKIISNDATWYGEPRFNYYSSNVGDDVYFEQNYVLVHGSVWDQNLFATNFSYKLTGYVDFTTLAPPPAASNTGYRKPTANRPDGGGDRNGYEFCPTNAYVADGVSAEDIDSGSDLGAACVTACKDKHQFYNFGFNIPAASIITGLEVRLKANADSANGSPRIYAQVSWDGGKSWTARKRTKVLGTALTNYRLGNSTVTWGRAWNVSDFTDGNFRVRLIDISSDITSDFSLDSVDVRVTYY